MLKLSQLKKLRGNTNKVAYVGAAMSVLTTYAALSGTKYPTRIFCFKPEVIYNEKAEINQNYCRSGETVWQTHPKFLLSRDVDVPNPSFVFGNDQFLIPFKGRIDKTLNKPSNPNYLWYALTACGLSVASYSLYSSSLKRYSFDFPKYYEQVKTYTFSEQLDGVQSRTVKKVQNELDTKYIVEKQTREHQIMQALEMSEGEVQDLHKNSGMQSELSDYQYQLQLSELAKLKALNDLEAARALKEKAELLKTTKESKQSKNEKTGRIEQDLPVFEKITWWDWNWLKDKSSDDISHIRLVAPTGCGKTTMADWMLDIMEGTCKIITIKRKPYQWKGRMVIGVPEDFEAVAEELKVMVIDRKTRLQDVADGKDPDLVNFVIDEWRAINQKIDFAQEIIRDTLCLSREAKQRLVLMAQGKQVKTFGLKDESDLEECLTSFFMGKFALEECTAYMNTAKHIPDVSKEKIIEFMEKAGNRALWVMSSFGEFPGLIPDLSENIPAKGKKENNVQYSKKPDGIDHEKLKALDPWNDEKNIDTLGF